MLIHNTMIASGNFLFRWRGQLPALFLPWLVYAVLQGEAVEVMFGELADTAIENLALGLIIGGLALRIHCVGHAPRGTSGRNKRGQVAEELNTTGLYSQCRNPLYLANCMMYVGMAVFAQAIVLAIIMSLAFTLYYERIILAEEAFLEEKFGAAYRDWASHVPAFVPLFRDWQRPKYSFSMRSTLRREYPGVMAVLILLTGMKLGQDWVEGDPLSDEILLWACAGLGCLGCVILDILKRKTSILVSEGR